MSIIRKIISCLNLILQEVVLLFEVIGECSSLKMEKKIIVEGKEFIIGNESEVVGVITANQKDYIFSFLPSKSVKKD